MYHGLGWRVHYPNHPIKWLLAAIFIVIAAAPFFLISQGFGWAIAGFFIWSVILGVIFGAKGVLALWVAGLLGLLTWCIAPSASGWVGVGAFLFILCA